MIRRLAVIPARGGSKRIPNKNIRDFFGKPIIYYILNNAKKSNLFNIIHVSTESTLISKTVENLGFKCDFLRPEILADDYTPIMPVLKFVVEKYETMNVKFDEIWLFMPCSPLITVNQIIDASSLYRKYKGKYALTTISQYPVPIEWAFNLGKDNQLIPLQPNMLSKRSQDLKKKYFDTGSFAIFSRSCIINSEGASPNTKFIGFELPKETSIDIDEEEDWLNAELLYKYHIMKD